MRTAVVIPARMGSGRLPGKVMRPVLGKPLLGHLLDRVKLCSEIDEIIVASSDRAENDVIESYCDFRGIVTFRGSEDDVLSRLLEALQMVHANVGVLLFGDGPLVDAKIVDKALSVFHESGKYDFVGNDLITTWPPGMEVEVFKTEVLADSARRCEDLDLREHGTLFIRHHPDLYKLFNLEAPEECYRPDICFEVDVKEDFLVIEQILEHFGEYTDVSLNELIQFMDQNPHLRELTANVHRRWKRYRDS